MKESGIDDPIVSNSHLDLPGEPLVSLTLYLYKNSNFKVLISKFKTVRFKQINFSLKDLCFWMSC